MSNNGMSSFVETMASLEQKLLDDFSEIEIGQQLKLFFNGLKGAEQKLQDAHWIYITRFIRKYRRSLRENSSTVGGLLKLATERCSLASALFVRQLLIADHRMSVLYTALLDRFVQLACNFAVKSADEQTKNVYLDLYALHYGCAGGLQRLLRTLGYFTKNSFTAMAKDPGVVEFTPQQVIERPTEIAAMLFEAVARCIELDKTDFKLSCSELFPLLQAGLNSPSTLSSALQILRALVFKSSLFILPSIKSLIASLLNLLPSSPSDDLLWTLELISQRLGPSSSLHRAVDVIHAAAKSQNYTPPSCALLASVLRTSGGLIDSQQLAYISTQICQLALSDPDYEGFHRLLIALLAQTNEALPIPIHVTRTVIERCSSSDTPTLLELKSLASVLCRPRIADFGATTVARVRRAKRKADEMEMEQEEENDGTEKANEDTDRMIRQTQLTEERRTVEEYESSPVGKRRRRTSSKQHAEIMVIETLSTPMQRTTARSPEVICLEEESSIHWTTTKPSIVVEPQPLHNEEASPAAVKRVAAESVSVMTKRSLSSPMPINSYSHPHVSPSEKSHIIPSNSVGATSKSRHNSNPSVDEIVDLLQF